MGKLVPLNELESVYLFFFKTMAGLSGAEDCFASLQQETFTSSSSLFMEWTGTRVQQQRSTKEC